MRRLRAGGTFFHRDRGRELSVAPEPLGEWATFVASPAAERIGFAVLRLGASFPRLSDDPLEQFLIEEAVLMSVASRIERERRDADAWGAARTEACELLRGAG